LEEIGQPEADPGRAMSIDERRRDDARNVAVNLIAQSIWVGVTGVAAVATTYLLSTADLEALWRQQLQVPAWAALAGSVAGISIGLYMFRATRRASVVRGREMATDANVRLLASRRRLSADDRLVQSTRFGQWPLNEKLKNRTDFRQELDKAILEEGAEVRRIWNINSSDDLERLQQVLQKYEGCANHSIRAYFGMRYCSVPELLIVERLGASISFPSPRQPRGIDRVILFRRPDLVHVVRDYFDVLWNQADKVLDAGEIVMTSEELQHRFRVSTGRNDPPPIMTTNRH
jgi:hypothetical protein